MELLFFVLRGKDLFFPAFLYQHTADVINIESLRKIIWTTDAKTKCFLNFFTHKIRIEFQILNNPEMKDGYIYVIFN